MCYETPSRHVLPNIITGENISPDNVAATLDRPNHGPTDTEPRTLRDPVQGHSHGSQP